MIENKNENQSFEEKIIQELKEIHRKIDSIYEFSRGIRGMDDAAKLLNISKAYLYQLTATNRIPIHKRAKLNYFVVDVLIEWLKKEGHNIQEFQLAFWLDFEESNINSFYINDNKRLTTSYTYRNIHLLI